MTQNQPQGDLPMAPGIGCLTVLWAIGAICFTAGPTWLKVIGVIVNILAFLVWVSSNTGWRLYVVGFCGLLGATLVYNIVKFFTSQ